MRPPPPGTCGMSVSVLLVLCTAGLLATAVSATQPVSQVLRASCDRYTDGTQKSVCLDTLAKLQQSLPANGAVRLHATGAGLASTPYRGDREEGHPHHQEPWYNHGPEDDTPYHSQHEAPHAEYEPYGDREHPPMREGPPTPYGQDPSAPSEPFSSIIESVLSVNVVPKNANATGRLTQDDFEYWSVLMYRFAALTKGDDFGVDSLIVSQYFECASPVTFDVEGTITTPTSMTIKCNTVPLLGRVVAGAKFDWQEAQRPRSWITVPNPTEFYYNGNTVAVSSIQSLTAFSGSIVDLMMDALLGQPADYAFTVTANPFVDLSRVPGAGKGAPANKTASSFCDKLTGPALLLCQQQESRLKTPLQQMPAAMLPSAPHRAPSAKQVPRKPQPVAGGAAKARAHVQSYGDGYDHSTAPNPATPLLPGSGSFLSITLAAPNDVANATGHLSDRDFAGTDVVLSRYAELTDRQYYITDHTLNVGQVFHCVPPVKFYFSGPVNQPNTIHVGCRMEGVYSDIIVGPKFPWSEAGLKKNEITIKEPRWAEYKVNFMDYEGVVTDIESQLPFAGSITDFMTEALFGRPSEFDFEVDLAALYSDD